MLVKVFQAVVCVVCRAVCVNHNQTHDLPASSAVPQPTAPPRAPVTLVMFTNIYCSPRTQVVLHVTYSLVQIYNNIADTGILPFRR